jgi:hypothetical protein
MLLKLTHLQNRSAGHRPGAEKFSPTRDAYLQKRGERFPLSPGERAGVRVSVKQIISGAFIWLAARYQRYTVFCSSLKSEIVNRNS